MPSCARRASGASMWPWACSPAASWISPAVTLSGVMAGIDFMRQVNGGQCSKLAGPVVVIGGGNIAADVARTAVRCGAESVDLYCLEGYDDMPMGRGGPGRV